MTIQNDPEIATLLELLADSLVKKGRKDLAYKMSNLLELHREELEQELKQKPRK